jgi:hypothetical protein
MFIWQRSKSYLLFRKFYLTNILLNIPFETQKYFNECFWKESVGKIYNGEEDKYFLFTIWKPVDFKGVYFCRLIKITLEYKEVNIDTDNTKINKTKNNEKYVLLYRSDCKAYCIATMTGNNFEIIIY